LVSEIQSNPGQAIERFKDAWVAFEAPGVQPAFAALDAKRKAIDYACRRFGGGGGEVLRHSFDDKLQPGRVHTSHF